MKILCYVINFFQLILHFLTTYSCTLSCEFVNMYSTQYVIVRVQLVWMGWQPIWIVGASACDIFILHQKIQKMAKCTFWYQLTQVVPDKVWTKSREL